MTEHYKFYQKCPHCTFEIWSNDEQELINLFLLHLKSDHKPRLEKPPLQWVTGQQHQREKICKYRGSKRVYNLKFKVWCDKRRNFIDDGECPCKEVENVDGGG